MPLSDNNALFFTISPGEEILRFEAGGKVFIRGQAVGNSPAENERVYEEVKLWLKQMHKPVEEAVRFRLALERITESHPSLVTRSGGPAPWLIAKAALLGITPDAVTVLAEWSKTEPRLRQSKT